MNNPKKHLGHERWFELYVMKDKFDTTDWDKTLLAFAQYIGLFNTYKVAITIKNSTVRYFVGADNDLGFLSNNLDGVVLRPIDTEAIEIPSKSDTEHFLRFVVGGNLLDFREKYLVKRSKELVCSIFTIRPISNNLTISSVDLYLKESTGNYRSSHKTIFSYPSYLLAIDFLTNNKYLRAKEPKYLDIQKTLHIMRSDSTDAVFEVDTFPYLPKNYFLPIQSYDFDKHSFIIGASGSGKSKLISLLIEKLEAVDGLRNNYRVVVIDPHASLEEDLKHITNTSIVKFHNQADGVELFSGSANTDVTSAVELTGTLFKSLLSDQFNPKLERVLRYSLFVLMTAQVMALDKLKRLLTDLEYRNQILEHVQDFIPHNIVQFFKTDFNELRTQSYTEAILPIISLVDEMQLQPALAEQDDNSRPLGNLINNNFLTVFSLDKISMGEKVVKTVAGLLMQQIFLLAQSHVFNERVILIIDEVSVVQNPAMASMLAEARKYNLFVFLTQQYFGQIDKGLQDAIFTNVSNYYVFRVSEEDAKAIEGNLTIEVPKEILLAEKEKGSNESQVRVRMLTNLNVRECLVRLSSMGKILPCVIARTMDSVITPRQKNEVELKDYGGKIEKPTKFIEKETTGSYLDEIHVIPHNINNQDVKLSMADVAIGHEHNKQPIIELKPQPPGSMTNFSDFMSSTSANIKKEDQNE